MLDELEIAECRVVRERVDGALERRNDVARVFLSRSGWNQFSPLQQRSAGTAHAPTIYRR